MGAVEALWWQPEKQWPGMMEVGVTRCSATPCDPSTEMAVLMADCCFYKGMLLDCLLQLSKWLKSQSQTTPMEKFSLYYIFLAWTFQLLEGPGIVSQM